MCGYIIHTCAIKSYFVIYHQVFLHSLKNKQKTHTPFRSICYKAQQKWGRNRFSKTKTDHLYDLCSKCTNFLFAQIACQVWFFLNRFSWDFYFFWLAQNTLTYVLQHTNTHTAIVYELCICVCHLACKVVPACKAGFRLIGSTDCRVPPLHYPVHVSWVEHSFGHKNLITVSKSLNRLLDGAYPSS